jgi:type III pantothenate kinase
MSAALARDTARLPRASGSYVDYPRSTADAITTGAIDAIGGAVERLAQRLEMQAGTSVTIIGTGGAIGSLAPHLAGKVRLVENLVLEGLRILAEEP